MLTPIINKTLKLVFPSISCVPSNFLSCLLFLIHSFYFLGINGYTFRIASKSLVAILQPCWGHHSATFVLKQVDQMFSNIIIGILAYRCRLVLFGLLTGDVMCLSDQVVTVCEQTNTHGELLKQVCGGMSHQYSDSMSDSALMPFNV